MSLLYAGFNFARLGAFEIEVTDPGGTHDIPFEAGTYAHVGLDSVLGVGKYASFATALAAALNAAPLTRVYSVVWNPTLLRYEVSANGTFTLTAPTGVAATVLGRTTGAASVTSFTSTVRPYYVIDTRHRKSRSTDDYEPDEIVEGGHTSTGGHFGIETLSGITFNDFWLSRERKSAVYERNALPAVPWTYQHFFRHVRMSEPFALVDTVSGETDVLSLRREAARFRPTRTVADWDGEFDLEFRCYLEGRI